MATIISIGTHNKTVWSHHVRAIGYDINTRIKFKLHRLNRFYTCTQTIRKYADIFFQSYVLQIIKWLVHNWTYNIKHGDLSVPSAAGDQMQLKLCSRHAACHYPQRSTILNIPLHSAFHYTRHSTSILLAFRYNGYFINSLQLSKTKKNITD